MIMFYVYVLKNPRKDVFYYGYTVNLKRRFMEHQNLLKHKDWVLIYYEAYRSEEDARKRERMLKCYGAARGHLKVRIQKSINFLDVESAG